MSANAAKTFNQREGNQVSTIYGAVTSGSDWKFLKLEGDAVFIDRPQYYLAQVGKILGILLHILQNGQASQALAARMIRANEVDLWKQSSSRLTDKKSLRPKASY